MFIKLLFVQITLLIVLHILIIFDYLSNPLKEKYRK